MGAPASLEDDGLFSPEVGEWAETKYGLIANYAEMFATSMKRKWTTVYIDPFAGAGRGKVRGTSRIVPTSPLLALDVRDPFDRYVFCDIDSQCIHALQGRVVRAFSARDVRYLTGDANCITDQILSKVPRIERGSRVLSFCVLDPWSLKNLHFNTVRRLASIFVDFLVLIPSYMDAHRNLDAYRAPDSRVVSDFVGNPSWREEWESQTYRGEFGSFIVDCFGRSMKRLGFLYGGPGDEVPVRLPAKNRILYHLAFYSKNKLGMKFWREARKYSSPQLDLFE